MPVRHGCFLGQLVLIIVHALAAESAAGQDPHPAVCRVSTQAGTSISYGSGTLVAVQGSYGIVVTNWHVVHEAPERVSVVFPDGFRSAARVLKMDRVWDLAALSIWRPNVSPVLISSKAPRPGETLTIAGYGPGSYRAATGRCTGYVAPMGNKPSHFVDVSVPARQGDSGGPIFNTRGELAGVLFGSTSSTTTGSYSARVRWFLESVSLPSLDNSDQLAACPRPDPRAKPKENPQPPSAPRRI
ncbi:MAG: trypsin-like peptidase domain-containing protein, partial [Planctomycetes bacterium]|nr:trypsin-like peptidase domain-containing protein [Planctomycetota bacterium]